MSLVMAMMVTVLMMTVTIHRFGVLQLGVGRRLCRGLGPHADRNDFGFHQRLEGNVCPVAEYQLQRMLAWRQAQHGFGLALAEMDMLLVDRNRLRLLLRRQR